MKKAKDNANDVREILDEEASYKRERRREERRTIRELFILDMIAFAAGNILVALLKTCGLLGLVCGGLLLALGLLFAALFCKFCGPR